MHVNPPLPDDGQPDITPDQAATERRCLVLGEALPRAQLIRFVVGPQHQVFPDIDEKLPGRGLWVSACRDKLAHAIKKNLFAKAARASAKPAADLLELTISLLQQKSLSLMGLANKAGVVVHGFPQVQAAAKAHQLSLLLTAPDAGADGLRKLAPFA
ncbi:MAG: DUF448 domain-containing protein, partial [Alphaproteobacteria bacterium]|nr:DUF448 domain-containing protein [Alphaproteobacteria bacterium]